MSTDGFVPVASASFRGVHRLRAAWRTVDKGMALILGVFLLLLPISTPRVALSDEVQYYAYLHSVYFDHDLDFRNEYEHFAELGNAHGDPAVYNALLRERDDPTLSPVNPATGKIRNLAPIGAALLWSPGFFIADLGVRMARLFGSQVAADGYSSPYIRAACFMSALYSLAGLLLSYRLARRFAGAFAAALAVLALFLASPLVFYTYIAMPWPHTVAFFLVSLFLFLWLGDGVSAERRARGTEQDDQQDGKPESQTLFLPIPWTRSIGRWALLGLIGALMTMTREQMALFLLLPLAEALLAYSALLRARTQMPGTLARLGVRGWPEAVDKLMALRQLFLGHSILALTFVLGLIPQLWTYQILNGKPLPSSTVSEKLGQGSGLSPHFWDTLFDPLHGAFLWSPILLVSVLGWVMLARRRSQGGTWFAGLALLGLVVQTYINGSFGTTWHLSGAFGFRRLIECTPLFALGLAPLFEIVVRRVGKIPLALIVLVFVSWNIGLIAQWTLVRPELRKGLLWNDMLYYQFVETPRAVVDRLGDLLFNRCRLVKNRTC